MKTAKFLKLLKLSWVKTIYFNFKYLPFNQAIKLPIFLFNPHIKISNQGGVKIDSNTIDTGMIQLGYDYIEPYPGCGIQLSVSGRIVFKGKCLIGNRSTIYVLGNAEIGDNFMATYKFELICFDNIMIGNNSVFAWDVLCIDSSQHQLTNILTNKLVGEKSKPCKIGANCWIASKCVILPGTTLSDYTTVTANTTLNKDYSMYGCYKLLGGSPVHVLKENVYLRRK